MGRSCLLVRANITEMMNTCRDEDRQVTFGSGEYLRYSDAEDSFDLTNEHDAEEWEMICKIKEIVNEFRAASEEEIYDMDITVISDGARGKFNILSSREDGYEGLFAKRNCDTKQDTNPIRKLNSKFFTAEAMKEDVHPDIKEMGTEYMRVLTELVDRGDLNGIDADDIKFAMSFAFDRRRGFDEDREQEKKELIKTLRDLIWERKVSQEDKILWARGLSCSLYDYEVKKYVPEI